MLKLFRVELCTGLPSFDVSLCEVISFFENLDFFSSDFLLDLKEILSVLDINKGVLIGCDDCYLGTVFRIS